MTKARKRRDPPLAAKDVLRLLSRLSVSAQKELFAGAVADGTIARSDGALVAQVLATQEKIGPDDEVLIETLEGLGRWVVK